ncbi:uncharacterized protein LOC127242756 [Andrographis paniculata]|uniref:uncharacterized protein LOC127242756 n=1 Tax=Andrographis paniculata TaxID=175694 RepID=UPI0021E747CA|nr:uncharacterized protein LOC127242756 [Andrographis paniculata]
MPLVSSRIRVMTPQPRRKKWTEAEERTLIDKYGEMACDGTLSKMKTREKKYRPIAVYVNSMHHALDPAAYPWQWTWKDVSTKVQNMRHQYVLVKQKIKKEESARGLSEDEEFDWMEGITHWPNFMRYKEVFGDVAVAFAFAGSDGVGMVNGCNGRFEGADSHDLDMVQFGGLSEGEGAFVGGVENGVMDLEFNYDGDEGRRSRGNKSEDVEPSVANMKKKRKVSKVLEKKAWGVVVSQLNHLKEMETRFAQDEVEREQERQRRDHLRNKMEKEHERKFEEMEADREIWEKLRRQWMEEWEAMERKNEEMERRREEELMHRREWEERMNMRRSEWKKKMDEMLSQHRAEMGQVQARILHEQQNITAQFVGILSQWTGHPTGLSDHSGGSGHYLSQMMQNLHHVNGMVHGDARVEEEEEDNQEDQFIVDG